MKSNNWKIIRTLVESQTEGNDLFLTVIKGDGKIVSVNNNLMRTLHLNEAEIQDVSFFQLIHPQHLEDFHSALTCSKEKNIPCSLEISMKNGYYHPMKWQVNALPDEVGKDFFLCIGHKILDEQRVIKFKKLAEQNYQMIMDGLDQAVIFHDVDYEIIAANQKASEILEISLEDLYKVKNVRTRWDQEWGIWDENGVAVPFAEAPVWKALKTGTPQDRILKVKLLTGKERWIQYHCQPLFDKENAAPYAVISNLTDVTDQKNLNTELEEMEAIIKQFIRQSPNLAWVADENLCLVFASESFYKYFQLEPANAIHRKLADLVPREIADALYDRHIEVLENNQPIEFIEKSQRADGSSFVFHVDLFPLAEVKNRKLLGGYAISLQEKYAVEKKLREANDRLLLLTRATSDAIWEWDMQTGYIFRNDALMDMIGYQLDNPKGLSWWLRRIHPEDRNRISDVVKDSTDNGKQSWEDEYRFKCADGSYKIMRDKGFIVYESGLPVKMIGSLQDVSGIRDLENKLDEEKLERQKEISETVIRVQEMERTRIGHELHDNVNQILSTTKLFVDMLKPNGEEEKLLKEKSVSYILLAIEEIRKLSKELVVPQLKDQGLVDSIKSLIDDIQLSTNICIRFAHDHETELLPPGIRITLFRIVQEQLKNILKHSQASEMDITLQLKHGEVQLFIRDNGIGFDLNKASRGIGLSNIHERTRFYNGTVDIQSAPGKGCTIQVSIPAA